MSSFYRCCLLSLVGLLQASLVLGDQTNAPAAPSPATNSATATPPPIALADVVAQAQTIVSTSKDALAALSPDVTAQAAEQDLAALQTQLSDRLAADKHFSESNPVLSSLQTARTEWKALSAKLDDSQTALTARVRKLDNDLGTFNTAASTWKATFDNAKKQAAPPDVLARIQEAQAQIDATLKATNVDLRDLYTLQNQTASLAQEATTGRDAIDKQLDAIQAQLFRQTQPVLWSPAALTAAGSGGVIREKLSWSQQVDALKTYTAVHAGAFVIHVLLFALLIAACFWIRRTISVRASGEVGLRDVERIFAMPVSTALLLSLFATGWLYPVAPRLLLALLGALTLLPTVIIVRRLIAPESHPLLYVTVVAYVMDQVRYVATPAGVLSRFVLLAEMVAMAVFAVALLRSRGLHPETPSRRLRITRAYMHLAFLVFLAAGFADIFGYVMLAFRLADGILEASYLAVILFAAVRILDALALAVMCLRPVSGLGMIRRHRDLVYDKVVKTIRTLVVLAWILSTLEFFLALQPVATWTERILATTITWGTIHVEIGALVAFPFTIWATFVLSRLVRFSLEEEVYPNLNLPRGIPYAASTMLHYVVLTLGFVLALSAVGIHLNDFALLASAFGVGLGFGLQNIMNNFISGLILLFERPIKVGDTIQIDATTVGKVERIGIRASIIQLANGSELIMPNGNLISNPVTNWTLSNNERLLEIPVTVTSKVDPAHVIELLVTTARAHRAVIKNPPPQAMVVSIGASTAFKLRVWTDAEDDWMNVTSELTVAAQAALAKENIALG